MKRFALFCTLALALTLGLTACQADPNQPKPTTAATASAAPVVTKENVVSQLLSGSTFVGTSVSQNNRESPVRLSFTKQGNEVLAQYGSTAQVPAQISGNTVTFTYRYSGRNITAHLTLNQNGTLVGYSTGPASTGGGSFTDRWSLKPNG